MKTTAATAPRFAAHDNAWGTIRLDPLYDLEITSGETGASRPRGHRVHRLLSYFMGPIIWAIEITVVLLIIADHSRDFVDAVIVADLVTIVLMMAFRAALGLWKDSHLVGGLDHSIHAQTQTHFDR